MSPEVEGTEAKEYYPYVTRSLLRLYGQGVLTNVVDIDVEPDYGYTTRITYSDGSHRITYGNDLGLNSGAASNLAKDKGHSKFMLKAIGVNYPAGEEFLLPWWADTMRSSPRYETKDDIRTMDQADGYVEEVLGYPVYIKPVSGSLGSNIYKLSGQNQLADVIGKYEKSRVKVALIEEAIEMPDYRVVCLDGELISAYQRAPLSVVGDGRSSIIELLQGKQAQYESEGRNTKKLDAISEDVETYLNSYGVSIQDILEDGRSQLLLPVSNLSTGGTSEDVTDIIHKRWSDLTSFIAKNFNLRLCGLDLACEDVEDPDASYSVLEVNSSPGLDHYAMSGKDQEEIVDQLYTKVFNALPTG